MKIVVTDKIELTLKKKEALLLIEILGLVEDGENLPDEHFDFGNELTGLLNEAVDQVSKKN